LEIDASLLIGIENPDEPVYRIFPLWYFEEALRLRQLVLVNPAVWEDPYEVLPERLMLQDLRPDNFKEKMFNVFLRPAYAQCWSRTKESDTLMRAYSRVVLDSHHKRNTTPETEGVRVRSTPRKLLAAMSIWKESNTGVSTGEKIPH